MLKTIAALSVMFAAGCDSGYYRADLMKNADLGRVCVKDFNCEDKDVSSIVKTTVETEFLKKHKNVQCDNATTIVSGQIALSRRKGRIVNLTIEAYTPNGELLCRLISEGKGKGKSHSIIAKKCAEDFLRKFRN